MSSRYDVFVPLVHRLAALAYALPFLAMLARAGMAVGPDASFINVALFVAVAIAPAVAWMLGVRWCRIVVVLAAIGSLLLWLLVPLAQHRIDRTLASGPLGWQ